MTNRRPHPNVPLARHVARPAALAALLLLTAACTAPSIVGGDGDGSPSATATSPAPSSTPDASPSESAPSPSEPAAPEVTPTTAVPVPDDRTPVSVATTYSGWSPADAVVMVGAYVEGVVESDGRCTLTLTGPGSTATVSAAALPDAGSTSCGELRSKVDASGTWTATVAYESTTSAGIAPAITVDVP